MATIFTYNKVCLVLLFKGATFERLLGRNYRIQMLTLDSGINGILIYGVFMPPYCHIDILFDETVYTRSATETRQCSMPV